MDNFIAMLLALILGFAIGYEREHKGKSIGIRTCTLICLGSTLFTLTNMVGGEPTRVAAQIVSGIGFLGAGLIFKEGDTIKGLTTAATVWTTGAIGCLIGLGMYLEAIESTFLVIIINCVLSYFKTNKNADK